jgi:hypothetical protein
MTRRLVPVEKEMAIGGAEGIGKKADTVSLNNLNLQFHDAGSSL